MAEEPLHLARSVLWQSGNSIVKQKNAGVLQDNASCRRYRSHLHRVLAPIRILWRIHQSRPTAVLLGFRHRTHANRCLGRPMAALPIGPRFAVVRPQEDDSESRSALHPRHATGSPPHSLALLPRAASPQKLVPITAKKIDIGDHKVPQTRCEAVRQSAVAFCDLPRKCRFAFPLLCSAMSPPVP